MSDTEDYTADDADIELNYEAPATSSEVPFMTPDEKAVDDSFDTSFLGDVAKPEEIEKGAYRFLSIGAHLVRVKSVVYDDKGKLIHNTVFVKRANGKVEKDFFMSRRVAVTFCNPNDENMTIRDQFFLPPTRDQLPAYIFGFSKEVDAKEKGPDKGGFWAKKIKQMLARIGFVFDANGNIPAECGQLKNWITDQNTGKPRFVKLEVVPGRSREYFDEKKNEMVKNDNPWPTVKLFSYTPVPQGGEAAKPHQTAPSQKVAEPASAPTATTPTTPAPDNGTTKPTSVKGGKGKKAQV